VPLSFNDRAVGLHGAIALLSALYRRERTGRGQAIEVPMFETMVQAAYGDHMGGLTFVPAEGPPGYQRQLNKERRPCATLDGYLCVIIYTDRHWRDFAALIGQPDLLQRDARFASITSRTTHAHAVYEFIAQQIARRTTAEWDTVLRAADIPVAPLHTLHSLLEDPHLNATGFFSEVEHPTQGRLRQMAVPTVFSDSPGAIRRHAPRLGEQTCEVLREAGLGAADIDHLLASGGAVQAT
jgi:crotonobetainyl-CoA:carnitine CoA-transferase CaiB-like acyl-CoA transferase